MARQTRNYTEEFKREAVSLALRSPSVIGTAKELGIPGPTLHCWIKQETGKLSKHDGKNVVDIHEELKNLCKENARLREEKEILKKAAKYFAKESR